ncbi:MAG: nucleoid-associated protein NdpA [Gammaproteobacteria bacterium]|nr:MAG: nucleoid-associated protein NdpA [Pseudomonadota bacterium]PIE38912.1 MAG: nucleoid-associated protein NdpA [Gammaproteobacteria bacterium]
MAIRHITVHHVTRAPEDGPVDLDESPRELTNNADIESLFGHFKRLFNSKPGKQFGRFHEDHGQYPAGTWTRELIDRKMPFTSWAQKLSREFKQHLESHPCELDFYILYIEEQVERGRRLHILLTETESGFAYASQLNVEPVEYLNTARLEIAARLEIEDWLTDTQSTSYLCLLTARTAAKAGDTFARAIGFQSATNIEQDTATFLDAIEQFCDHSEEDAGKVIRKKAYDFCVEQHKAGEPVRFEELSGVVDEESPNRFAEFAKTALETDNTELRPDYRKLKRLVRFSGKGNGISLSFSSDLIESSIIYDRSANSLIIKDIPKTLKQQLSQYFEQKKEGSGTG